MTFILTKTGETTVDFSTATIVNMPTDNWPSLWYSDQPTPMPYPIITGYNDWLSGSTLTQYGYQLPSESSVAHPTFDSSLNDLNAGQKICYGGSLSTCYIVTTNAVGTAKPYISVAFGSAGTDPAAPTGTITWSADGTSIKMFRGRGQEEDWTVTGPGAMYSTTAGVGILNYPEWNAGSNLKVYLGTIDGTWYNAFALNEDAEPFNVQHTNDGTYNYTMIIRGNHGGAGLPPANFLYAIKWQPTTFSLGGTFSQTTGSIQFSDGTDDAILQAYLSSPLGSTANFLCSNTNEYFIEVYNGLSSPDDWSYFAVSKDLTTYRKINVTGLNSHFADGIYMEDIDGNPYFMGADPTVTFGRWAYLPGGGPSPSDSASLRAWRFPQDNHDFYVVQLSELTLVYDKLSNAWSQWKSPGFEYFRGADGCEWKGINVCCDTESSKVWQIDPEGRLDYGTTPITSTVFAGLTERFRTFVPCYMAELAVSEGQPPTGIDATTVGMRLRSGDGQTWFDHGTVPGAAIGTNVTVRWYGIGLMQSPGMVFEITDTGYARCISGFTIETGKFDPSNGN